MLRDAVVATPPDTRRTGLAPRQAASRLVGCGLSASSGDWLLAIDAAWQRGASSAADQELLVALRRCGEAAVERVAASEGSPRVCLACVPFVIALPTDVPESQVDHALACGAEAIRRAVEGRGDGRRIVRSHARLLRYDEVVAPTLSSVHGALHDGVDEMGLAAVLDRLPFHASSFAMHLAPIYLRFIVGVGRAGEESAGPPNAGDAVRRLLDAALAAHLGMEASVEVLPGEGFYASAYDGLRHYQSARIRRLLAADRVPGDVQACVFVEDDDASHRRIRLRLPRCKQPVTCMLRVPCDESERDAMRRVKATLHAAGVAADACELARAPGVAGTAIVF